MLLCHNWKAGFRDWKVKDNSSRVSLAGCQWVVQCLPQLSAVCKAHAGVHIRRDSICSFDGSVIAASVCPQLGFRYSPPITCFYRRLGSECVFSHLSSFVSEEQYTSDHRDNFPSLLFFFLLQYIFKPVMPGSVSLCLPLSLACECCFTHYSQVLSCPRLKSTMITQYHFLKFCFIKIEQKNEENVLFFCTTEYYFNTYGHYWCS